MADCALDEEPNIKSEGVLLLWPPGLIRNWRFWFIQAMVAVLFFVHLLFAVSSATDLIDAVISSAAISCLLVPTVYAAFNFGIGGSLATAGWVTLLMASHLVVYWRPNALMSSLMMIEVISLDAVAFVLGMEISIIRASSDRARFEADHDLLTGLGNRRHYCESVRLAWQNQKDSVLKSPNNPTGSFALLVLDLDDFKLVNDTKGHVTGDNVLREVALRLQTVTRVVDVVFRLGGDEFAVLLTDLNERHDVLDMARRISTALNEPYHLLRPADGAKGPSVTIHASIGVAMSTDEIQSAEEMVNNADMAMYAARAAKIEVLEWTPALRIALTSRAELEHDLQLALERDEFVLHYQPVVSLETGWVIGVESLLRWNRLGQGLLSPTEFICALETSELIVPVGRWALDEACRQLRRWHQELVTEDKCAGAMGLPTIGVNVSGVQLRDPGFAEDVLAALTRNGLKATDLVLEITESVALTKEFATLSSLRDIGIRIAIDDFGTGYSSWSLLRHIKADILKIDKSFVDDISDSASATEIVQGITQLAKSLGLETVAEGVEFVEQLRILRAVGCDKVQGFLLAKPAQSIKIVGLFGGPLENWSTWFSPEMAQMT